jgi:hypothetical protein
VKLSVTDQLERRAELAHGARGRDASIGFIFAESEHLHGISEERRESARAVQPPSVDFSEMDEELGRELAIALYQRDKMHVELIVRKTRCVSKRA